MIVNKDVKAYLSLYYGEKRLDDILSHLGNPPSYSSIRINTIHQSIEQAEKILKTELSKQVEEKELLSKEKLSKYGKLSEEKQENWTIKKFQNVNDCFIIPSKSNP